MVNSETLPMDDGRAGSIVLTLETHICLKKKKTKTRETLQTAPSSVSLVEQPPWSS